ncbi:MAG: hypothetical protein ACR2MK_09650 [Solirubrobacteraceae bacterium]
MSELLAIFGAADADAELLTRITAHRPTRVAVLIEDGDADLADDGCDASEALRDRLAELLSAIDHRTGATVVGLAGERSQLRGRRFDHELAARVPVAA